MNDAHDVRVFYDPNYDGYRVLISKRDKTSGDVLYAKKINIEYEVVAPGERPPDAIFISDRCRHGDAGNHTIESLKKAVMSLGIKSASDHEIEGVLSATREHLKDMREIVYHKLGMGNPKP